MGVFDQDREFGIDGHPDAQIPGAGVAVSANVNDEQEDDGSDTDVVDAEEAE